MCYQRGERGEASGIEIEGVRLFAMREDARGAARSWRPRGHMNVTWSCAHAYIGRAPPLLSAAMNASDRRTPRRRLTLGHPLTRFRLNLQKSCAAARGESIWGAHQLTAIFVLCVCSETRAAREHGSPLRATTDARRRFVRRLDPCRHDGPASAASKRQSCSLCQR